MIDSELDKLLLLQRFEIDALRERSRIKELKNRLECEFEKKRNIEDKISGFKEELKNKRNELQDIRDFISYKELRLKELKKLKSNTVNRKDFKELLRKIAKVEDEIIRAKSGLSSLQVELDDIEENYKDKMKYMKSTLENISNEISKLEKDIKERIGRLEVSEKKLIELKKELSEGILSEYGSLKNKYDGLVFADISSGACEGCGMSYSSAEFVSLLKNLIPGKTRCPYCGRFVINRSKVLA